MDLQGNKSRTVIRETVNADTARLADASGADGRKCSKNKAASIRPLPLAGRRPAFMPCGEPKPVQRLGPDRHFRLYFCPTLTLAASRNTYWARRSAISYRLVEGSSLSGGLGASHCLANFETFELRVIQIQRLVVPCPTVRCAERL
jgi:hypothetical protein